MLLHVVLRQFDTDSKALHDKNNPSELQSDLIGVAPCQGIDEVGGMRTKDDADQRRNRGFSNVQSFFDNRGT